MKTGYYISQKANASMGDTERLVYVYCGSISCDM